jgi:hypothetical protein
MSRRCLAVGPYPVSKWRNAEWHHQPVAAVDTGLTAVRTRRPIFDMVPSCLRANRTLAQPQGHADEGIDVVGQADAVVAIRYVRTRLLIEHEHG